MRQCCDGLVFRRLEKPSCLHLEIEFIELALSKMKLTRRFSSTSVLSILNHRNTSKDREQFCQLLAGGPGFDSRALLRIFLRELGLERGPLSLVIG
jgi:hypothetical protein